MHIIVDGYNLIGSDQGLRGPLEPKRTWLIQRLAAYRKVKGFGVTVVFDGWRTGREDQLSGTKDGVTVIYSRLNEKADSVIIQLARQKAAGAVVVTSDREIRTAVERLGAVAVSVGEFDRILRDLDRGVSREDSDYRDDDDRTAEKDRRGNPNRPSKAERRRNDKLKKLRL